MVTLPSAPTPVTTRLAIVWPALKLRLEVPSALPLGLTESQPAVVGLVAVTLRMTPVTPAAGTPPCPVTCRSSDWFGPGGTASPRLDRLSAIRAGVSG